jgi:hypothetical protein
LSFVEFDSFHKEEHPCSTVFLSANKYIRKMKGGSQSILVQCDDNRFYVVKMAGNPQGSNILANEFLGSVIAHAVGLPVAECRVIRLSDHFIDSDPELWFELSSGRKRPEAGLHFGSLLVGQPSGCERPSEYISRSRINTITNRDAFLGMYILDVWANQQDNRQAVLLRQPLDGTQEVFFIDHGHMFGGSEWNFEERPGAAFHLESSIYTDLWHDDIVFSWISHFRTVVPEVLSWVSSIVPSPWYNGDLRSLLAELIHRLTNLTELVQKDATTSRQFVHQNSENETLRLSNSGIYRLGAPDTRSTVYRDLAISYAKFIHSDGLCFARLED